VASVVVSSKSFQLPPPPLDDREDDLRGDSELAVGVIVLASPMEPSPSGPVLTDRGGFGSLFLELRFLLLLRDDLVPPAILLRDRCFALWRRSGVKNPGMMIDVQMIITQPGANCGDLSKGR